MDYSATSNNILTWNEITRLSFHSEIVIFSVGTICWGIHNTTRGLLSLRKRGMITICVDSSHPLLSLRNFRFCFLIFMMMKAHTFLTLFLCFFVTWSWVCLFFILEIFSLSLSFYYQQEKKLLNSIRQYQLPLQKYSAVMDLQVCIIVVIFTWSWNCCC